MITFLILSYFIYPFIIVIAKILFCIANKQKFSFIEVLLSIKFYVFFIFAPIMTWMLILLCFFLFYAIAKKKSTDYIIINAMEFLKKMINKNKE